MHNYITHMKWIYYVGSIWRISVRDYDLAKIIHFSNIVQEIHQSDRAIW